MHCFFLVITVLLTNIIWIFRLFSKLRTIRVDRIISEHRICEYVYVYVWAMDTRDSKGAYLKNN